MYQHHSTTASHDYGHRAPAFGESPGTVAHWVLPLGRSWQAVVAGYVALVAMVFWPLGPVAFGLGGWALIRASRDGSRGRGRAAFAVVIGLVSTMLLVAWLATG